jgi:hypothetical protein
MPLTLINRSTRHGSALDENLLQKLAAGDDSTRTSVLVVLPAAERNRARLQRAGELYAAPPRATSVTQQKLDDVDAVRVLERRWRARTIKKISGAQARATNVIPEFHKKCPIR